MTQPVAPSADRSATPGWKQAARVVFLVAALVAAGLVLHREGAAILAALAAADPRLIALALIAAIANVVLTGLSWRALLSRAPVHLDARTSARIFFLGQIGKYLPGTVWSFLASGELARQAGFSRGAAMSSLFLALLIGVGSGIAIAIIAVPATLGLTAQAGWVALALLGGTALMFNTRVRALVLRTARIDFAIPATALAQSTALAVLAWGFAGAQVLLLAHAIGAAPASFGLVEATGAYAFAWLAGFAVFIAPAGLGAREGGLIAMLSLHMGLAEATAVIVLSRLAVTCADFACAGMAMALSCAPAMPAIAQPPHQG